MAEYIEKESAVNYPVMPKKYRKYPTMNLDDAYEQGWLDLEDLLEKLPVADVVEVVRCKDCEHWRQQTNYQGAPLSFGFCESDDMRQSLYGETCEVSHIDTDDDFYCGHAKRRTNG